jgi:hypothetical protein
LRAPTVLRLTSLQDRSEDVREFLRRWLMAQGFAQWPEKDLGDIVELITSPRLLRGFVDLGGILQHLVSAGWNLSQPPRASALVNSYQDVLAESKPAPRVILVEGETDAVHFEWVAQLALGAVDADLSIEPCGSATKVMERSVACRNEGRAVVALFDYHRMGKKHYDDLRQWGHACEIIPPALDPLRNKAPDHVFQVVEIEDVLPVASIDRFCSEFGRTPEVEIVLGRHGLRRVVPHADDKLDLARWIAATLGPEEAINHAGDLQQT